MSPNDLSARIDADAQARRAVGAMSAAITDAAVSILRRHTGHGPTEARTTIDRNLVVILMRHALTHGETVLADVDDASHASVMRLRRAYQEAMRKELVARVERICGRSVQAFMSTNHTDPDWAAEIFVLENVSEWLDSRSERT